MCARIGVTQARVFWQEDVPEKGFSLPVPCVHTHPLSPVLPETPPRLATPPIVEVGTQWSVDCTLDGVFPASEAQVHLALAEERLHSTVLYKKDSLSATANVKANPEDEGTQQLWCEVTLGDENRRWQENVTFYSK